MKKIKWAVMLIAALSIMFSGCKGDPEDVKQNLAVAGKPYVVISGRTADYMGIDVKGYAKGDVITIYVAGGSNSYIQRGQGSSGWGNAASDAVSKSTVNGATKFVVDTNKDATITDGTWQIRPVITPGTADYVVYEIIVEKSDGTSKWKLSEDAGFLALPKGVDTTFFSAGGTYFQQGGSPTWTIVKP
jgi:hypothetical protein